MSAAFDHNLARNFDRAVIAKLTVKKILHQIDYIETMVTCGSEGGDMKIVLPDWFAEMRVHLRRLEVMAEQFAQ